MPTHLSRVYRILGWSSPSAIAVSVCVLGCQPPEAPPLPPTVTPRLQNVNVVPPEGNIATPTNFVIRGLGLELTAYPPDALLRAGRVDLKNIGAVLCGNDVRVVAADKTMVHGRVLIFSTDASGKGPAGRGDYLLKVPEERIRATSGGRMSMAYESYTTTSGKERYAWIAWMSERPLPCDDKLPPSPP